MTSLAMQLENLRVIDNGDHVVIEQPEADQIRGAELAELSRQMFRRRQIALGKRASVALELADTQE